MKESFTTYGILIIAIYGVVQIWLIAIWKHFIWKGSLIIYKSGRLEVGYSNFGPTLTINGTLRAERKTVFVREISAVVTRERDGSVHQFEWTALKSTQLRIGAEDPITLELPAAFNVSPAHPHRFNIFFSDRQTKSEFESALVTVEQAWQNYLNDHSEEINAAMGTPGVTMKTAKEGLYSSDFSRTSQEHRDAFDILARSNYWTAGTYRIRFEVRTSGPDKEFSNEWEFSLSDQEFDSLRLNSVVTLLNICIGDARYYFAYPDFT